MNDDILVQEAQAGSREAFERLYEKYKKPIFNYIYRFINNRHSAEELAQEAFIRAYVNIKKYKPKAKFSSWLYKISGNLAKNFLRHASYDKRVVRINKNQGQAGPEQDITVESMVDHENRPDRNAQTREIEGIVQDAISQLPAQLKQAIILCDISGFSYDEAASIMDCRPMTVGSRLWRARERLSRLLDHIKHEEARK
jgi:RNA polymerase sigma-70 factor, ECF subfamily